MTRPVTQTLFRLAPWTAQAAFGASLLLTSAALPALAADYRLEPGDVIEMTVTSVEALRARATVGDDGKAGFPLAGQIVARGLTLKELTDRLHSELSTKFMRQRSGSGSEFATVLSPDDITITIAEYRPVYLLGDIARPGAQVYRPGLSVRQAVALAGGYDLVRVRLNNPFLDLADFKGENERLWIDYARLLTARASLTTDLSSGADPDYAGVSKLPVPPAVLAELVRLERERFLARREAFQKERQHLGEAVQKEDQRVATLAKQQQTEEEGAGEDTEELSRVKVLFERRQVTMGRVNEARRNNLFSATRVLQTITQTNAVERQRDETVLKLKKLEDQRQLGLLTELQDTETNLAATRVKLEAIGTKLAYSGMLKSQMVGDAGTPPDIAIIRSESGQRRRLAATEDTDLAPGDVIEVAIRNPALGPSAVGPTVNAPTTNAPPAVGRTN